MDVQNVGIIAILAAIKILLLATVQNYEYYKSTNLQLKCSLYEL
jgi:Tfp pilus assembly major pilin PilA